MDPDAAFPPPGPTTAPMAAPAGAADPSGAAEAAPAPADFPAAAAVVDALPATAGSSEMADPLAAALDPIVAASARAAELLVLGGPVIWLIAGLSVATTALVLLRLWVLAAGGMWRRRRAARALALWRAGRDRDAAAELAAAPGPRARFAAACIAAARDPDLPPETARAEAERLGAALLDEARRGLRPLELVASVAPLLGLLGTVLGMIEAFRQLQAAGARTDPAMLAGGIWEALLTTAAGMAVAILATVAGAWLDATAERLRRDLEDIGARIFLRPRPAPARLLPLTEAAE